MDRRKLIDAREVAKRLCVSKTTAYQIIRELNVQIAATGKRILAGKVDERFFESTFFTDDEGKEGDTDGSQQR